MGCCEEEIVTILRQPALTLVILGLLILFAQHQLELDAVDLVRYNANLLINFIDNISDLQYIIRNFGTGLGS